jgi:hypothetical protein
MATPMRSSVCLSVSVSVCVCVCVVCVCVCASSVALPLSRRSQKEPTGTFRREDHGAVLFWALFVLAVNFQYIFSNVYSLLEFVCCSIGTSATRYQSPSRALLISPDLIIDRRAGISNSLDGCAPRPPAARVQVAGKLVFDLDAEGAETVRVVRVHRRL